MDSTASPPVLPRLDGPRTEPGLFGRAVLKLVAQATQVDGVQALSPHFRQVSLRAEAFRQATFAAGDKLQVRVDGMAFRTFTPFRRQAGSATLELLGYAPGDAPAARWLKSVAPGDRCDVRGPRRSLDLGAIERSTVFVGDETSLGLALALCDTPLGGLDTHFLFEVGDAAEVRGVLEAVGRGMLAHASLVERRPGDAHLADIESALARYAGADAYRQYVFSGRSLTLQRLQRTLRAAGAKPSQVLAKAYWAPGKIALD